ncbi:MAG TPA: hypothetical protein ENF51_00230 [Candidatus Aenigmarchaeota archaeon]|nr:hypothetical protein [Candidatus Aenigmarchaeota archaeon]
MAKVPKKYRKFLTNLVVASSVGMFMWFLLLAISGLFVRSLWSEASLIFGLFVLIPAYITVFAVITWALILQKK